MSGEGRDEWAVAYVWGKLRSMGVEVIRMGDEGDSVG